MSRGEPKGHFVGHAGLSPVGQCRAAPVVRDVAAICLVPAGDIAIPDFFAKVCLQAFVILFCCLAGYFDNLFVLFPEKPETAKDVFDLAFHHKNNRVVAQIGVWAIEHKKVREVRTQYSEIRMRPSPPAFV